MSAREILDEFPNLTKRNATAIIAELSADTESVLITQHGKPAAYLMAVNPFEPLTRRLGILGGGARGKSGG